MKIRSKGQAISICITVERTNLKFSCISLHLIFSVFFLIGAGRCYQDHGERVSISYGIGET